MAALYTKLYCPVPSSQSDHAVCGWNERCCEPQRDGTVAVHTEWQPGE